jgi:hypothetical protein
MLARMELMFGSSDWGPRCLHGVVGCAAVLKQPGNVLKQPGNVLKQPGNVLKHQAMC